MKGRFLYHALELTTVLFFYGCINLWPDYQRPDMGIQVPQSYEFEPIAKPPLEVEDRWWEIFEDGELDQMVEDALKYNWDIKQAAARILEVRARYVQVRSDRFPEVDVGGARDRRQVSGGQTRDNFTTQGVWQGLGDTYIDKLPDQVGARIEINHPVILGTPAQLVIPFSRNLFNEDTFDVTDHVLTDGSGHFANALLQTRQADLFDSRLYVIRETGRRRTRTLAVDKTERVIEANVLDQRHGLRKILVGFPGKPIIKSDDMLIPGRAARKRLITDLYSSAV